MAKHSASQPLLLGSVLKACSIDSVNFQISKGQQCAQPAMCSISQAALTVSQPFAVKSVSKKEGGTCSGLSNSLNVHASPSREILRVDCALAGPSV